MPLQNLEKKVRHEVDFLHADEYKNSLQVDFNTSEINVSYKLILSLLVGMIRHFQSTQSNKFLISLLHN